MAETQNSDRHDVVTFGEAMVRLSVPRGDRLVDAASFDVHVGGAEANVAAVLAQLGRRARWLSDVPADDLGDLVLRRLRAMGVDVAHVQRQEAARLGIYYFEPGVPPRPSRVIYDRAGSALREGDLPEAWLDDVEGARLFHVTGVTAALGPKVAEHLRSLVERATSRGVPVSYDVNYRSALWSATEARPVSRWLLERSTIVLCSLRDGPILFGDEGRVAADRPPAERAERLARAIAAEGPKAAVVTIGDEGTVAYAAGEVVATSSEHAEVIDRVGAGDALAAGVIDGWLDGDVVSGVRLGGRLAALALAQRGDMVHVARGDLAEARAALRGGAPIVR